MRLEVLANAICANHSKIHMMDGGFCKLNFPIYDAIQGVKIRNDELIQNFSNKFNTSLPKVNQSELRYSIGLLEEKYNLFAAINFDHRTYLSEVEQIFSELINVEVENLLKILNELLELSFSPKQVSANVSDNPLINQLDITTMLPESNMTMTEQHNITTTNESNITTTNESNITTNESNITTANESNITATNESNLTTSNDKDINETNNGISSQTSESEDADFKELQKLRGELNVLNMIKFEMLDVVKEKLENFKSNAGSFKRNHSRLKILYENVTTALFTLTKANVFQNSMEEAKYWTFNFTGYFLSQVYNNVGLCRPFFVAHESIIAVGCDYLIDPLNVVWFCTGWALAFLTPLALLTHKLSVSSIVLARAFWSPSIYAKTYSPTDFDDYYNYYYSTTASHHSSRRKPKNRRASKGNKKRRHRSQSASDASAHTQAQKIAIRTKSASAPEANVKEEIAANISKKEPKRTPVERTESEYYYAGNYSSKSSYDYYDGNQ